MRRLFLLLTLLACAALALGGATSLGVAVDLRLVDGAAYAPPVQEKVESVARTAGVRVAVAPAPEAERLPAIPPTLFGGALQRLTRARFERAILCGAKDGYAEVRVRRHVPRMDSGDPPRA